MMVLDENLNCGICNIVMERGVWFDILWFNKKYNWLRGDNFDNIILAVSIVHPAQPIESGKIKRFGCGGEMDNTWWHCGWWHYQSQCYKCIKQQKKFVKEKEESHMWHCSWPMSLTTISPKCYLWWNITSTQNTLDFINKLLNFESWQNNFLSGCLSIILTCHISFILCDIIETWCLSYHVTLLVYCCFWHSFIVYY